MLWEAYLRSAFYAFICVIGIIGNLFVIFFFGFKMKRAANFRWFVIHLAIADCTYAILTPIQLLYLMFSNGQWELGPVICKFSYIGPITVNVSAFIMVFMAYERYRAICHPFGERLSKHFINIMVATIWVVCILLKIPVIYRLSVDEGECILLTKTETEHLLISLSFVIFESILPLTLLSVFFLRITNALKKHGCFRENSDSQRVTERYQRRMTELQYNTEENCSNNTPVESNNHPKSSITSNRPPPVVIFTEFEEDQTNPRASLIQVSPPITSSVNKHHHLLPRNTSSQEEAAFFFPPSPSQSSHKGGGDRVSFSLRRGLAYSSSDDAPSPKENFEFSSSPYSPPHSPGSLMIGSAYNNFRTSYTYLREFVRKHSLPESEKRLFGVKDKNDQATVSALFLSVMMFAITSVPYNLYYFIITCIFLYHPDVEHIFTKYGQAIIIVNEWLGIFMLSGCIMNIIVYSGKFPQFRHQAYIWITKLRGCCIEKESYTTDGDNPQFNNQLICNNSSFMASSYYTEIKTNYQQPSRHGNNYVKV